MHASQENRNEEKPDVVQFYNQTKAGVDHLDKLVRSFRSQRKCRRWPYGIFFTLCDVAVITACKMWNKDDHYLFKRELSHELALSLIHRRINILGLRQKILSTMANVGVYRQPNSINERSTQALQGRCRIFPRHKDKKSKKKCQKCFVHVCNDHLVNVCMNCIGSS